VVCRYADTVISVLLVLMRMLVDCSDVFRFTGWCTMLRWTSIAVPPCGGVPFFIGMSFL